MVVPKKEAAEKTRKGGKTEKPKNTRNVPAPTKKPEPVTAAAGKTKK